MQNPLDLVSFGPAENSYIMENHSNNRSHIDLVENKAPDMLLNGQYRELRKLLDSIPAENYTPWLRYWAACADLPVKPFVARKSFARALVDFEAEQNLQGVYLSWAGIVDSFLFSWDDFKPLDSWIKWMQDYLPENPVFPSAEAEHSLVFGMFCSMMYRQPQHPDLDIWLHRLGNLLEQVADKNRRLLMATHYVLYLAWMGEFNLAELVIERLKPSALPDVISPPNLIAWYQTEAMHYWLTSRFQASKQSLEKALVLSEQSGIHSWDFILTVQHAYLALEMKNKQKWPEYNRRILTLMDKNGRLHQAYYHYYASLESIRLDSPEHALLHINKSLKATVSMGTPYPTALNQLAKARIYIALGELDKAGKWLEIARHRADTVHSEFLYFNIELTQAELYFAQKKKEQALPALELALQTGRRHHYINTDWWRPDVMCELGIQALQNDIEVEYVQQLVSRRKLLPAKPPFNILNWPWRIKIYTLGRFSILVDNVTLKSISKGHNKPLELLKVMISFGGRGVAENLINDVLWPDAEGDSAHSAFTTTLSRLRKLLGADVLQLDNSHLSLNDHLCWLDSWAVERTLGELDGLLSNPAKHKLSQIEQKTQHLFALYHGLFMEKESQQNWMLAPRNRLQSRILRTIKQLIAYYARQGKQCEKVIELYEKSREIDPCSEEYCRGLMRCHAAQGNRAEAVSIYQSCQLFLQQSLGIKPSRRTQQLYQKIRDAKPELMDGLCQQCVPVSDQGGMNKS